MKFWERLLETICSDFIKSPMYFGIAAMTTERSVKDRDLGRVWVVLIKKSKNAASDNRSGAF